MAELVIGDPAQFSSDLGPVIDAAARTNLLAHIETHHFDVIAQCALSTACEHGHFVAPTVIRLRQIEDLRREVFGPVLHVATFKSGELELAVQRVNASGYGLTMGLHRRSEETLQRVRSEEHTSELQSLIRISSSSFCLTKK